MNLHACLGVGPGHRLLLGSRTPASVYSSPVCGPLLPIPAKAVLPVTLSTGRAHTARQRRSRKESTATKGRILSALIRGDDREEIARREEVSLSYVNYMSSISGLSKPKRSKEEVDALRDKAIAMLKGPPPMQQKQVSAVLKISAQYLCIILARRSKAAS